MGFSTEAAATVRPQASAEDFAGLLAGFRDKLDRALAAWLDAKREEAAAAGSPETLELIDGVGRLATHGGKRLRRLLRRRGAAPCPGDGAAPYLSADPRRHHGPR